MLANRTVNWIAATARKPCRIVADAPLQSSNRTLICALIAPVKDGADRMSRIEFVPTGIVLAGKLGTFDPFHAPDRHDVRAVGQERRCLAGLLPVRVQQQPRRRDVLEVRD